MKKVTAFLIIITIAAIGSSFSGGKEKINWITFEEMQRKYAADPKPIIVDLYTSWCGWCKEMDRTTYQNSKVADYINTNFYAVKYDAESRAAVTFNSKSYDYNRQYRTNDLAVYLTSGQLEYPTTVFLSSPDAQPAPLSGYITAKDFEAPLKYFGERAYKKQSFIEFNRTFSRKW